MLSARARPTSGQRAATTDGLSADGLSPRSRPRSVADCSQGLGQGLKDLFIGMQRCCSRLEIAMATCVYPISDALPLILYTSPCRVVRSGQFSLLFFAPVVSSPPSRLVTSRHTHIRSMYACTCTYLREASCGSRVLNEPSPSLSRRLCETDAASQAAALSHAASYQALRSLSFFPPTTPLRGALVYVVGPCSWDVDPTVISAHVIPLHSRSVNRVRHSQPCCEYGFVIRTARIRTHASHGHFRTLSSRSEGPTA